MLRSFTRENDRLECFTVKTDDDMPSAAGLTAVWYDLLNPTQDEDHFVEQCLAISVPTREEMEEIEPSARLYNEAGAEFMTVTAVTELDTDDPVKTPITFILKGGSLVTVRYADPRPFTTFANRLQKAPRQSHASGEIVMLGILEVMVGRLADVLERGGGEIDAISREVFRNKAPNASRKTRDLQSVIERIGRKGDLLALARESLVSVARLLTYHQAIGNDNPKLGKEARQKTKVLQRDVASLSDHATFLSNKVSLLLDATLGLINLEQNQIIKIFSVAAVVFLPPTLVASIYGMNFDYMPELKWLLGYPWAFFLMILSAVLPFLYFKRRGWL